MEIPVSICPMLRTCSTGRRRAVAPGSRTRDRHYAYLEPASRMHLFFIAIFPSQQETLLLLRINRTLLALAA